MRPNEMRTPGNKGGNNGGQRKTKVPPLIPQPHGGALRAGGTRGHAPPPGRPPSELRERLRGSFDERVKVLEEIADDSAASSSDRIRAIDLLAKYGLGALQGVPDEVIEAKLVATADVIEALVPEGVAETVLDKLRSIWNNE